MNHVFYHYIPALVLFVSVALSLMIGSTAFSYIAIIYWTIFRADVVPISLVFILGILYDALSGVVIGQNAFIFTFLMAITYWDRKTLLHQEFKNIWLHVCMVLLVTLLGNILINWSTTTNTNFACVYDTILANAFFPLFAKLMFPLYNKLNQT